MPQDNYNAFGRVPSLSFAGLMGELSANSLGFSTVNSASTPTAYFVNSVDRLNQFLSQTGYGIDRNGFAQGEPRIRSGAEWDRIIRENTPNRGEITPQSPGVPGYPSGMPDPSQGNAGRVRRVCSDASGKLVDPSLEGQPRIQCSTQIDESSGLGLLDPLKTGSFKWDDDAYKRIFLGAMALILIAAAVISLR